MISRCANEISRSSVEVSTVKHTKISLVQDDLLTVILLINTFPAKHFVGQIVKISTVSHKTSAIFDSNISIRECKEVHIPQ